MLIGDMDYAPVVLFIYNRPWHTRQTVEALQNNELATATDLIIYSDAPKTASDTLAVQEVRSYVKSISGFKSVTLVERAKNMGLANSVIDGVTTVCAQRGRIIVLEDDMVTSPYFLRYMNDALELYENEKRVISIHGYMYPVKKKLPETFFLQQADCWGWATWKHGWDLFEQDGEKLLTDLAGKNLLRRFDLDGAVPYTRMLKDQIAGKNNSWAIRWQAAVLLANRLTLFPGVSLVQNIGLDQSGTHCAETENYDVNLAQSPIQVLPLKIEESTFARTALINYYRAIQSGIFTRIVKRILRGMILRKR